MDNETEMITITAAAWKKIHKDFKGTEENGAKSAFNGSIRAAAGLKGWGDKNGTDILVEGIHFQVKG